MVGLALVVGTTTEWIGDWRQVPVVAEGLIMIDDSINPMLPVIGADLDRISAPFSGERWNRTLADPARADWLFVDNSNGDDSVAEALARNPEAFSELDEVFTAGEVSVYRRREGAS